MLTFKHEADRIRWRASFGRTARNLDDVWQWVPNCDQVRCLAWISLFHALSVNLTGRSAVVTSWWREDETGHYLGEAVDFRIRGYSRIGRRRLERAALRHGLPIVRVSVGTPSEHWHCGHLATLASEIP